jgi:hypothetical protein
VPGVQRAHRGHQANFFAFAALFARPLAQFSYSMQDFH